MEVLLDHYTPSVSLQMLLNSLGGSLGPPNMPHLRLTREQLKQLQASVEGVILLHLLARRMTGRRRWLVCKVPHHQPVL